MNFKGTFQLKPSYESMILHVNCHDQTEQKNMVLNAAISIFCLQLPYIPIKCVKKCANELEHSGISTFAGLRLPFKCLHLNLMFELNRWGVCAGIKLCLDALVSPGIGPFVPGGKPQFCFRLHCLRSIFPECE